MAQLIVRIEGEETTVPLVSGEIVSVGRDPGNTIALTDEAKASRRHCQFTPVRRNGVEAWEIADLGATNKTRVNGKPTDKLLLTSGDEVEVGSVTIRFDDPDEESRLRDAGKQGVCFLEWVTGDKKGAKVMLAQPRMTLGRRDSNDIPLDDRMSSGHHCEITKDLNGYTIRDLGSTNGTLVNGEPTTEIQLAHGSRIRVGNSRFVFKDPSMKDVEVELSQFEEDDGWGMMGDIDLTKARGSYTGLLIGLVILGLAGAGGWYISQNPTKTTAAGVDLTNEIENGDMEDAEYVLWGTSADREDVSVRIVPRGKHGKGLQLQNEGDEAGSLAAVLYEDEFDAVQGSTFKVEGWFKPSGTGARFVAVWRRRPRVLTHTQLLSAGTGGWQKVDRTIVRPSWATALQLAVILEPGATATLDGIRLEKLESVSDLATFDAPGEPTGQAGTDGGIDLVDRVGAALLLGARPIAEKDGQLLSAFIPDDDVVAGAPISGTFIDADDPVPVSISWNRTEQGLAANITCAGATRVGLATDLPRANVGDRVSALCAGNKMTFLPIEAGAQAGSVVKSLSGALDEQTGRGQVVMFIANDESGDVTLELADPSEPALITLRHWVPGESGLIEVVTDLSKQRRLAQQGMQDATQLLRTRPGPAIHQLRSLAQAFPFEKALKDRALRLAQEREERAYADLEKLREAFASFRIYRSAASLTDVEKRFEQLASEFPSGDGTGGIEQEIATLGDAFADERREYHEQFAGPELARLERLADMLKGVSGYEPMAGLYLRAIWNRFQDQATEDTAFGRRVLAAKKTLDEMKVELPPQPGS